MNIIVAGNLFKVALRQLLHGSKDVSIVMQVKGSEVCLQTAGVVIDEIAIPVKSTDGVLMHDIAFKATKVFEYLDEKSDVTLAITFIGKSDVNMSIVQNGFTWNVEILPDQYIALEKPTNVKVCNIAELHRLRNIMVQAKQIAKVLIVPVPDMLIYDGAVYVSFSNIVIKAKTDLPDCRLSSDALSKIVASLSSENTFDVVEKDGALHFITTDRHVAATIRTVDKETVRGIEQLISKMQSVSEIDADKYEQYVKVFSTVSQNQMVDIGVADKEIRLSTYAKNCNFRVGSTVNLMFSFRLSATNLAAIFNLCHGQVIIEKGDDCILWKTRTVDILTAAKVY